MLSLTVYPNGEFSAGYCLGEKRRSRSGALPQNAIAKNSDGELSPGQRSMIAFLSHVWGEARFKGYSDPGWRFRDISGAEYEVAWTDNSCCCLLLVEGGNVLKVKYFPHKIIDILAHSGVSPLGLSEVPILKVLTQSPKTRTPKGARGMTRYMGRKLRCTAQKLQEIYGKDNLAMLTVTLPEVSQEELDLIWSRWDYLCNRFITYIRERITSRGGTFDYVFCTEVQPARFARTGQRVPHLHLVYSARPGKKRPWYLTPSQCRRAWGRCIRDVLGRAFPDNALENLQKIRRNCSAYLGKYLSKGDNTLSGGTGGDTQPLCGLHWGGCSRTLSTWFLNAVFKTSASREANVADLFIGCLPLLVDAGLCIGFRKFSIGLSQRDSDRGGYSVLGYYGILSRRRLFNSCREAAIFVLSCCESVREL